MISDGAVVLLRFPHADRARGGKLRPGVAVRRVPGRHEDWLICMVSTQLDQKLDGVDELIADNDPEFAASGLKATSVLRVCRIAVVHESAVTGAIGVLGRERLQRIRASLTDWIAGAK